ncbi:ribosome maturation factor RimP [Micrococcus terreus]|uniref:ribosome maturation factor RimP n=1 Tax=Micrococcus terreus TaxID=574650 RepID=UPI002550A4CA|nr:ribosome assembly cofactor RimP [Micrococcus terreus]MDK7701329.1 ribosome assembly cofactor RimP [Micrococcus terreus]WOO97851.1 ribosome assembly cofactor RimP [Micrococcus terreus]
MTTTPSSLQEIIAPAVESSGLVLEECGLTGEGDHRTLHVVVDRSEGTEGLDLDTVSAVATAVSSALDAAGDDLPELGRSPYQLEVSSPGVSRPLTDPRHWRRNVGRTVSVSVDGADPITARVVEADPDSVVLAPVRPGAKKGMPAKEGAPERLPFSRLGAGTIQVELTHGAPAHQDGDAQHGRHPQDAADDVSDTEA